MNTNRKLTITLATITGLALVSYLGWWAYKKYRTSSKDPRKNNRNIQIVRA